MSLRGFLSLWREKRGEGALRDKRIRLPVLLLAVLARRRRRMGFYDFRTLALFRAVWRHRRSTAAFLEYIMFRRDLGYPLQTRWLPSLRTGLGRLRSAQQHLALALIAESDHAQLSAVPATLLAEGSQRMAPLASSPLLTTDVKTAWLARLDSEQQRWRDDFATLLRHRRADGICVVGNAGTLAGGGHGPWIDGHGLVVRFNRFRSAGSAEDDIGARIDIWVSAPGFPGVPPEGVPWTIVTGPDMRFRRQSWGPLRPRLEEELPVLTVPLTIWRELVPALCAPPSAGLLLLAWLRVLLGGWDGIAAIGLGVAPAAHPYHHADPRQNPVGRHHWQAERRLLLQWRAEGLQMRGSGDISIPGTPS